jgi:hypothetical protein
MMQIVTLREIHRELFRALVDLGLEIGPADPRLERAGKALDRLSALISAEMESRDGKE